MPTLEQKGLSALRCDDVTVNLTNMSLQQYRVKFANGGVFNFVNLLSGASDVVNKNYSNFYLTAKTLLNDAVDQTTNNIKPASILTRLKFGTDEVCPIKGVTHPYVHTIDFFYKLIVTTNATQYQYFSINFVNDEYCTISYNDGVSKYFIVNDGVSSASAYLKRSVYITDNFDTVRSHHFKYILNGDKLLIFQDSNILMPVNGVLVWADVSLMAVETVAQFAFTVDIVPDITTTYNLNNAFAEYIDGSLDIDYNKIDEDIPSNYLVYKNITDADISKLNIIKLKNQMVEVDSPMRGNNLHQSTDTQLKSDIREYTSIFNTIPKEEDEGLDLNYVTYNKAIPISYGINYFRTSESLFPFSQININDTCISKQGAFAAALPIYSDKIYIASKNNLNQDKLYLCTWLSGSSHGTSPSMWVDRYYYPDLLEKESALSSTNVYNTTYDQFIENLININSDAESDIAAQGIFDKKSDLTLSPSTSYIYDRFDPDSVTFVNEITGSDYYEDINSNSGFVLSCDILTQPSGELITISSLFNIIQAGLEISYNNEVLFFKYRFYNTLINDITEIEGEFALIRNNTNNIVVSVNSEAGKLKFYLNSKLVIDTTFPIRLYNPLIFGDFVVNEQDILESNNYVENVYVSTSPLDGDLLNIHVNKVQKRNKEKLFISIPCGMRNKTDSIKTISSLTTSLKSKSNTIDIYLNNIGVTNEQMLQDIKNEILLNIDEIIPTNMTLNAINIVP